jgi:hypothetical protein
MGIKTTPPCLVVVGVGQAQLIPELPQTVALVVLAEIAEGAPVALALLMQLYMVRVVADDPLRLRVWRVAGVEDVEAIHPVVAVQGTPAALQTQPLIIANL